MIFPPSIANVLDKLGILVGRSHERGKFYKFMEQRKLFDRTPPFNARIPFHYAFEQGYAKLFANLKSYYIWSSDFVYDLENDENRFLVSTQDIRGSYFSQKQLCSPDVMSRPFTQSEIKKLLAPYKNDDGTPTEEALEKKWALEAGYTKIFAWEDEKIKAIFEEYQSFKNDNCSTASQ
jgi:hypothetical protein